MRDGLSLIGLDLYKGPVKYRITAVYVTRLNYTYLAVNDESTKCTTNYKFSDIKSFLTENGFSIKESVLL